ncbi:MAG: A24 family peptidase [Pirellulaceae bacterium]
MLSGFIALPLLLRLLIVLIVATVVARFINWAIYTWAYNARSLGPWSQPVAARKKSKGKRHKASTPPPRSWLDHLPVIGWFRLRGEASEHGRLYWLRPLLIEFLFPLAMAWYYHFYVSGQALQAGPALRGLVPELHWQCLAHFALFTLMAIGTFIDFDEQSIPDYVTIPGTVIGLCGAAFAPAWLPFHVTPAGIVELHAAIPRLWPEWLDSVYGLLIGLAIVLVWGFALLARRVIWRRGFTKAVQYFIARMFRNAILWKTIAVVTLALLLLVAGCWTWNPGRWPYLLSSLLGLAFAGGLTWGARIAASHGMQMEALGFGDVTLMAMIGTYIGWQPSLLVFFLAPMVAIVFVLTRTLITGRPDTPFGPYLCAATVLLLVYWTAMWTNWAAPVFSMGGFIVGVTAACIVLLGVILWIWRLIKQSLGLFGQ